MTEKLNTVKLYGVDPEHTRFGGYVYISDFNTDYKAKDNIHGSTIPRRIAYDQKIDDKWRKDIERRQNGGKKNA